MNVLRYIGIFLLLSIGLSCSDDDSTQDQESQNLQQLFAEIQNLATSEVCNDAGDWTFIDYGSKACGGPVGFIAYSTNIDTNLFLAKIEEHRSAQRTFNQKWEVISDCAVPPQPIAVDCEDGNAILEF